MCGVFLYVLSTVKVLGERVSFIGPELITGIKHFQDFCLSEGVDI